MPLRGSGIIEAFFAPQPIVPLSDITWSSNQALTTDVYARNLTIDSGLTIQTQGCGIFVPGILTIGPNVLINTLTVGDGGVGFVGGAGGAAGTVRPVGSVGGSVSTAGAGGGGSGGLSVIIPSSGILMGGNGGGGSGGLGGVNAGGDGGLVGFGGAAGGGVGSSGTSASAALFRNQAGTLLSALNNMAALSAILTGHVPFLGTMYPIYGGAGGGGGGQDSSTAPGTYRGGGGGAGGGVIRIIAGSIVRSGGAGAAPRIEAKGGNGGNADGDNGGATGQAGPGGGGGGGVILLATGAIDSTITFSVLSGLGGVSVNFGGSAKGGGDGSDGRIFKWFL